MQILQVTKSDLNETMINLEQSEALALNLEQAAQDKVALQKRLKDSLEKEGKIYKERNSSIIFLYCLFFSLSCFDYRGTHAQSRQLRGVVKTFGT